jgi:hypothetical protein
VINNMHLYMIVVLRSVGLYPSMVPDRSSNAELLVLVSAQKSMFVLCSVKIDQCYIKSDLNSDFPG